MQRWIGVPGASARDPGTVERAEAAPAGTPERRPVLPACLTRMPSQAERPFRAVLNLPPGWMPGGAAVVVARGRDVPYAAGRAFSAAVVDGGAALLELQLRPDQEEDLPATFAEALTTLRIGFGAGLVVAVGYGRVAAAATLGLPQADPREDGDGTSAATPEREAMAARGLAAAGPDHAPLPCGVLGTALPGEARFAAGSAHDMFQPW